MQTVTVLAPSRHAAVLSIAIVAVIVAVMMAFGAPCAMAQESSDENAAETAETADDQAPAAPSEAPFMEPLRELASILGSMHFLRTLCADPKADIWREKMQELIATQSPNEADRRRLIASFNAGYRGFEASYRKCTPAARTVIARYRDEGIELAREIGTRYGN